MKQMLLTLIFFTFLAFSPTETEMKKPLSQIEDLLNEIIVTQNAEEWKSKDKYPVWVWLDTLKDCHQPLALVVLEYTRQHPESVPALKPMIQISYGSSTGIGKDSRSVNYLVRHSPENIFYSFSANLSLYKNGIHLFDKIGIHSFSKLSIDELLEFIQLFDLASVHIIKLGLTRFTDEKFFDRYDASTLEKHLDAFLDYLIDKSEKRDIIDFDMPIAMLIHTPTIVDCLLKKTELQSKIIILFNTFSQERFTQFKKQTVSFAKDCQRADIINMMKKSKNFIQTQEIENKFLTI